MGHVRERPERRAKQVVLRDYYDDGSGKAPRYYQINATYTAFQIISACERQDERSAFSSSPTAILLVVATGTGKPRSKTVEQGSVYECGSGSMT
jgi:type I site-specific restriction endonuclease